MTLFKLTDESINLALLLNPIHLGLKNVRIFEAAIEKVVISDYGECGATDLALLKELNIPEWYKDSTMRRKVRLKFSILCAESVKDIWINLYPDITKVINAAKAVLEIDSKKNRDAAFDAARTAACITTRATTYTTIAHYAAAATAHYAAATAAHDAADAAFMPDYDAFTAAHAATHATHAADAIDLCALADKSIK